MKKLFRRLSNRCHEIAIWIIVFPMISVEAFMPGNLPTDQAFSWIIMIMCSPITLTISLPFWIGSSLFRWMGGRPYEEEVYDNSR